MAGGQEEVGSAGTRRRLSGRAGRLGQRAPKYSAGGLSGERGRRKAAAAGPRSRSTVTAARAVPPRLAAQQARATNSVSAPSASSRGASSCVGHEPARTGGISSLDGVPTDRLLELGQRTRGEQARRAERAGSVSSAAAPVPAGERRDDQWRQRERGEDTQAPRAPGRPQRDGRPSLICRFPESHGVRETACGAEWASTACLVRPVTAAARTALMRRSSRKRVAPGGLVTRPGRARGPRPVRRSPSRPARRTSGAKRAHQAGRTQGSPPVRRWNNGSVGVSCEGTARTEQRRTQQAGR